MTSGLKIWILKTAESCPYLPEEKGMRAGRACLSAEHLSTAGHEVTWFNSSFNHTLKSFRNVESGVPLKLEGSNIDFVFLDSIGYQQNVSFNRFVDHFQLGRGFRAAIHGLPLPDLIVAHFPIVDLAWQAIRYGAEQNIPVVVDVRDMWPDVIYERLNQKLGHKWLSTNGLLVPYERMSKTIFSKASAVTAVSSGMLDWVQNRFNRPNALREFDFPFYQTQPARPEPVNDAAEQRQLNYWLSKRVDLSTTKTRFVWAGNIVRDTDAMALLEAMKLLPTYLHDKLEIVICGTGDFVQEFEKAADKLPFLKVVGWTNYDELDFLLNRSHVGLLCYLEREDFQRSIPNKVIDYTSASMRILTNLTGEIARITSGTDVLIKYETGNGTHLCEIITDLVSRHGWTSNKPAESKELFFRHFSTARVLPDFEEFLIDIWKRNLQ